MKHRLPLKFTARFGANSLMAMTGASVTSQKRAPDKGPIVLYCDLAVDPTREQEMLHYFHEEFRPAAQKFNGYIDVKMLKFRKVVQGGPAPASSINYRFQLTYESEEKRQEWIASEVHQRVWPLIEDTVINKSYLVLLTNSM
jgi:hypothetical protein